MEIVPGRLIAVDIKFDDKTITFVKTYAPNDDIIHLFEK